MAFLCPVRIGKSKKNKAHSDVDKDVSRGPGMGRITGSSSIETLVRVGIEKENGISPDSKNVVLHDFTPCVDDELHVRRGQIVNILYRENDWVYVIAEDSRQEGFIPHSYCTPYLPIKLPRDHEPVPVDSDGEEYGQLNNNHSNNNNNNTATTGTSKNNKASSQASLHSAGAGAGAAKTQPLTSSEASLHNKSAGSQASLQSAGSSQPDVHPFCKDPSGRFIVLYTFIARDENDVSVERGEFVTVLNREDPDWFWIVRSDGQEGFVPSGFVYPADVVQGHLNENNCGMLNGAAGAGAVSYSNGQHLGQQANQDIKYHGTELVMLYDYKAQAPDDLSVRRGDWIYADLPSQTVDGWLWAFAPKTRKYGFIPKAYARPPAMTCL